MTIVRIAAFLALALAVFPVTALSGVDITFTPDTTINVAEGGVQTVTAEFDDTGSPLAPLVFYIDTTGFSSGIIDTSTSGRITIVTFRIAPGFDDANSNYIIRFFAADNAGNDTIAYLHINVTNVARPPVILNLPDTISIIEGDNAHFQVAAFDPDNNIAAYSILPGSAAWTTINSATGLLSIGPVPDTVTNWQNPQRFRGFTVVVTDNTNRSDTALFGVTVTNFDRPPRFMVPSRDTILSVIQGTPGSLIFRVIDPDSLEGDSPVVTEIDDIDTLGGWQISFSSLLLTFTPPLNFEGLASQTGFRFVAARQGGGLADTISVNFNVVDNIAPGAVTSFNCDSIGAAFGTVHLSWSAPHEDGNFGGAASSYVIKYATTDPAANPQAWWNTAQTITEQPPAPAEPGILQALPVAGLREYRSYWFGIKAIDASGNASAASFTGAERSRQQPPTITLLGQVPSVVRADSILHFEGVAADSGGTIASVAFDSLGTWRPANIDSVRDQSSLFVRKYFHFAQAAGSSDTLLVRIRAADSSVTTIIQRIVFVDNIRPAQPLVQVISGQDSATANNSFQFSGTKDRDASVWLVLTLGSNIGQPIRITQPGDNNTAWSYQEVIYYQGAVSFAFYATDPAGNSSDITRRNFWLILSQGPINIIDTASIDYHNSTVFNPQTDSFYVTFNYPYVSLCSLSVVNRQGSIIHSFTDSLDADPGTYRLTWNGIMNRGPDAGRRAPDGIYLARYSARVYPVSVYDIPIEVELVLDSYSPYEVDFFPRCGDGDEQARMINSQSRLYLTLGDTGAVGIDTRAELLEPYLAYGTGNRLVFGRVDTAQGLWNIDLAPLPPLPAGAYPMTLVISDAAGNENRYEKFFEVTSASDVTGFVNYPNPFAPSAEPTRITYVLGRAVNSLILEIFDSAGDIVFRRELDASLLTPAAHEFTWDGKSLWGKMLNNGVYFARLTGDIETDFHKIAIADR